MAAAPRTLWPLAVAFVVMTNLSLLAARAQPLDALDLGLHHDRLLDERQIPVSDCTDEPAGTSCNDGNFCTMFDKCDDTGYCEPGVARNCSYLNNPTTPCIFGGCEPTRGCELKVYAPNTVCDTDHTLCTAERCDTLGRCILYGNSPVVCVDTTWCNPATGRCQSAPLTPSLSASMAPPSSSASVSSTPTYTDTTSAPPSPTAAPTISRTQITQSKTGSMTPRPFWWLATPSPASESYSPEPTQRTQSPTAFNDSTKGGGGRDVQNKPPAVKHLTPLAAQPWFLVVMLIVVCAVCLLVSAGAAVGVRWGLRYHGNREARHRDPLMIRLNTTNNINPFTLTDDDPSDVALPAELQVTPIGDLNGIKF